MVTTDEYIELLLAEKQILEPLQGGEQNILYEAIPEAVKKHLLKHCFQ